jgi:hypothetical protein
MGGAVEVTSERPWSERYLGGSPEREAELLQTYAEQIVAVQDDNLRGEAGAPRRGFHAKQVAGIEGARFVVAGDVPAELRCPLLQPGSEHAATVRFSNGSGLVQSDRDPDLRGIGVRVHLPGGPQDLLCTNTPASHARDAAQFMAAAVAMAGGRKVRAFPRLVKRVGTGEALRITSFFRSAIARAVTSMAEQSFWSRAPFAIGDRAVRMKLESTAAPDPDAQMPASDGLSEELATRLRAGELRWRLLLLPFVDEATTPIEDGAVAWPEDGAVPVAELVLPTMDLSSQAAVEAAARVDALYLNPWNEAGGLHPIGSLNRARKPVYEASANHRTPSKA